MLLDHEEYVEQAYFFRTLGERMRMDMSTQDLLVAIRQEILATTKLPMALEFMEQELRHTGGFSTAMAQLQHYFTPFQTFIVAEAETEGGRFDFRIATEVLEKDAEYRAGSPSAQGVFLYQFETLCRNRLGYDRGLAAMTGDPVYDDNWREWILTVRRQIGIVDFADMIYVRSEHYLTHHEAAERPILFGEKEGRIALANQRKDPLFLFSALQRHLGYPAVPRPPRAQTADNLLPQLERKVRSLEQRMQLIEEEARGGIDISRFYGPPKE
ncbi:MAG TPA: hypothetical protein VJL29_11700 [Thermoguttaceae bacterium]|nr:hypothetical protein [Thermoguttaceae bacterium]